MSSHLKGGGEIDGGDDGDDDGDNDTADNTIVILD